MIYKYTNLWLHQGVSFEDWSHKKNTYLMNTVGVTFGLLDKQMKKSEEIVDIVSNCQPHASQFYIDEPLEGTNHLSLLVKEISKHIERENL